MRNFIFIITVFLFFISCNENKEEKNIRHEAITSDSLKPSQIEKIKKIHYGFQEVYPISLKETMINFQSDMDPEGEIEIWLSMMAAYESYLNAKQNKLDLNTKKEVFNLILLRSMMVDAEVIKKSELRLLNEKDAMEVLSFYTDDPIPIDDVNE